MSILWAFTLLHHAASSPWQKWFSRFFSPSPPPLTLRQQDQLCRYLRGSLRASENSWYAVSHGVWTWPPPEPSQGHDHGSMGTRVCHCRAWWPSQAWPQTSRSSQTPLRRVSVGAWCGSTATRGQEVRPFLSQACLFGSPVLGPRS